MSDDLMLDVGQANELKLSFRRNGWKTNEEIKRLSEGSLLAGVLSVLNGTAKIKPITEDASRWITLNETTIAVNLAATPNLPFNEAKIEKHIGEGWVIVEKRPDGLYISGRKVIIHLSKRQRGAKSLGGHELRDELTGKPVLNSNILDALYGNPHLIPEDWKKDENGNTIYIFFWGTLYRDSDVNLYVRCLYFFGGRWYRLYGWLDYGWSGNNPAALLASI